MKLPLLFVLCACACSAYSQRSTTHYFNVKDEPVESADNAAYYVLDSLWDDLSSSSNSFYVSSNKPRYAERRNSLDKARMRTWYYESGGVQMKGFFKQGLPIAMVSFFYENAKPMSQILFKESRNFAIMEYWDSLGNKIVDNGNGTGDITFRSVQYFIPGGTGTVSSGIKDGLWKGTDDSGVYEETYKRGELINGTMQSDGKTYAYTKIEAAPEFVGGVSAMSKFVAQTMRYPAAARRMGREGVVFMEFIVERDGSITGTKVIKGVAEELDAEALRVVSKMPRWTPGSRRGVPVRTRFVLPVKFVLG